MGATQHGAFTLIYKRFPKLILDYKHVIKHTVYNSLDLKIFFIKFSRNKTFEISPGLICQ